MIIRKIVSVLQKKPDYIDYLRSHGVSIGDNVHIIDSLIDETYSFLISIGNNVTITGASVLCHDASTKKPLGYTKIGKVTIGSNVFIGRGSIVLPNTTIGEGTVIGAGTVVSGNIPPNSVVVGNPCQILCSYEEYLEKHKKRMNESTMIHKDFNELTKEEMDDISSHINGIWYAP